MAVFIIIVLSLMNFGEAVVIWQLINRLLIQARIPTLSPVLSTPPSAPPEPRETRRKLFSVNVDR